MSLAGDLAALLGARVDDLRQLSGGSSRETWSFTAGGRAMIAQLERSSPSFGRLGIEAQARTMRVARSAGVPVPAVLATGAADGVTAVVLEHVDGETIARRILREDVYADARARLVPQCGEALARLHAAPLDDLTDLSRDDQLASWRAVLDATEQKQPALELGFRWLERNRPPSSGEVLVHGDFRLGNLIVGPDGLRAVIDWELAHVGDPLEDLGWLMVRAWRFGARAPVAGLGAREELLDAYARASGRPVDRDAVRWWEAFGNLRWAIICILQAQRHLGGDERSVELVTIGRRVCEAEHDLLLLLP